MPCPCCHEDPQATEWRPDPLRWELRPPCTQAEWDYLKDMREAPEEMDRQECGYMNNICRKCYSLRLEIKHRVVTRIRERGGLEEIGPSVRMRKEYEAAHASDVVAGRAAKVEGLTSAAGAALNGQYCKLVSKDAESERWTVELVSEEQKSIREANLMCSSDIDQEYLVEKAKVFFAKEQARAGSGKTTAATPEQASRPLGQKTPWPKVKGVHPGAVVRLHSLKAAAELNGRIGRCVTFDNDTGRWKVDLGDEFKSLKPDNFTPAPGEKPPTKESAEAQKKSLEAERSRRGAMSAKEVFAEDYGWGS